MVMRATASGREYRIFVALPERYTRNHPPYPVLYAADANAEFFTLAEAVRLAAFGDEIPALVVVGIGYDVGDGGIGAMMGPRFADLTPTRDTAYETRMTAAARAGGFSPPEGTGGASNFLEFIRSDLVPVIERRYNVSSTDRGWFGHSAGGLFGVYALLNNDGLFKRFLIGSPPLRWDQRAMFAAESVYAAKHPSMPARVFFAAGGNESAVMLDNLRAFVSQLARRRYEALEHTLHIFEGEGHDAVIPATVSRGIRYLYGRRPNP
jgi:predicted alpha/beta superfamily hydrolase